MFMVYIRRRRKEAFVRISLGTSKCVI